jgi:hypothetical protein
MAPTRHAAPALNSGDTANDEVTIFTSINVDGIVAKNEAALDL